MFELAQPWVLIGIIIPAFIWFLLPRAATSIASALEVPFYTALSHVLEKEPFKEKKSRDIRFFYILWILLILALSGPRWIGPPLPQIQEGRNLMLVLDLSESMGLEDMPLHNRFVSRLAVVKTCAKEFVEARVGDKIGLILFGTRAYLQTPLTFDRSNVLMRIEDASLGLAGNSTSLGDALGLAVKRLQNVPKKSRVIVLLTDGANNSGILLPLKAAQLAKDDNIRVYTIGLGSEMASSGYFNAGAGAELDEKTLQEIADMTKGRYFRASDPKSLQDIYETINQLETIKSERTPIRPQKDYYPWPLGLALLLFLAWLVGKTQIAFMPRMYRLRRPLE